MWFSLNSQFTKIINRVRFFLYICIRYVCLEYGQKII